jgi:signal transduction histidine kinase
MSTPSFTQIQRSLLYGGARTGQEYLVFVVNAYMVMAFWSLVIFGLLNIWEGRVVVGRLEVVGAVAVAVNMVGLRLSHNVMIARAYFLCIIMTLLFVMLVTGGTAGAGIFWFFTFPVTAFFLAGRRQGVMWMMGLYAMIIGSLALSRASVISIPYAPITIRQLLVSVGVVAVGIYAYQGAREQAQRESEAIDRAKSEFVALASHQLRTPISAISWFSELLLSGDSGKLTREQRDSLDQIYASNQRMAALVGDMLMVSSLDMKSLPVEPVKADIAAIAWAVHKGLEKGPLVGRKLTIHEDFAPDLPKVTVDRSIMHTIMHNLLSNAVKYTPDGGTVTISLSRSDDKLYPASSGSLRIVVKDTGYGIPKAAQTKVFSKFFRSPNIKEKDTDGTGLGLFIVKNLLEYVGGRVDFTSRKNAGSTFTVTLPLEGMQATKGAKKDV